MEKIKVFLQYPWKFLDSPYYKSLVDNPPGDVEYVNSKSQKGATSSLNKFRISNFLKRNIRKTANFVGFPIPNARKTSGKEDFDVIHCAHCLSLNDTPWVADFEDMWQLWISGKNTKKGREMVEKMILNKNCKKIMPWTEFTKKRILSMVPGIKDKIEIVYPAVPIKKFKRERKKSLRIIYASRYFWIKGGLVALETLKGVKEKYQDIEIIFISDVPQEIRRKYKNINFMDLVSQEVLFKYLKDSDIFFYPSFIDTFGFSLLEAMSFGVPIVSLYNEQGTPSRKEIINDGKNGFLIDFNKKDLDYHKIGRDERELIEKLKEKIFILIKNKSLRRKMGKNCLKTIESGKFSVKERNRKLDKIYTEALK